MMIAKTVSAEGLRSIIGGVLDSAMRGQETLVTRHGRPVAVIVDHEKFQRLQALQRISEADRQLAEIRAGNFVDWDEVKAELAATYARSPEQTGA
jgi:prevent-host-death family protein